AIYLAGEYGIKADIIEMLSEVNGAGNMCHKTAVMDMLMQHEIPTHFNTKAVEIRDKGIRCEGPEGEVFIEADTIIIAAGMKANQEQALRFNKCARMFYMIGECKAASNIFNATGAAYSTAKFIGRYYRV
ncbi:MAG: FAD-dependent oxidoreductase, partial [Clostridiales bacterium]|nr:FAD-dependent oxidoreductase [Clostridiales bacterium]